MPRANRPIRESRRHLAKVLLAVALAVPTCVLARTGETVSNPLLPSGPDPWIVQHDGDFYFTATLGNRIALRKTRDLGHLAEAPVTVVLRARAKGPGSASVWAPELHYLDGKWFLYFAASDKAHDDDAHRQVYVLENASTDPTKGRWRSRGALKIVRPGIDPTVFQLGEKL